MLEVINKIVLKIIVYYLICENLNKAIWPFFSEFVFQILQI
jgi:hypothetical protein